MIVPIIKPARLAFISLGLLMILSVIVLSCKSKTEQVAEVPQFKVLEIKGTILPVYLEMVGQTVGIPTVEIRARVDGYLQKWSFTEGSIVKQGQLLFSIEPDKYKNNVDFTAADLASKQASWEKAKLDVARLKPLLNTKAISQNDYDVAETTEKQTRAAVESAKANLADATLNLSYTAITSPINGCIGKVNVNPGNLVGRGESTLLTTVSAVDPIYIEFQMTETDYLKIMQYIVEHKKELAGEKESIVKIYLTLADKSKYSYSGKIDFIDRAVNTTTGTIAMRGIFPNPDGLLKPGNFATVNLVLMELENGIVIPQSATTQIQGKVFAFLVDNENKVTRVPIILGRSIGNNFIVNYGLKPGDRIMLEGFQKFRDGMQIKPEMVQDTIKVPVRP